MHARTDHSERPVSIAAEPDFRAGGLSVQPRLRQVAWDGGRQTLEPRAMQVLVALGQSAPDVVSRDSLILRCWDGRIVGENAINRVISILRKLGRDSTAFEIETIPKVGYRLRFAEAGEAEAPPRLEAGATPPAPSRRNLLFAASLAGVAIAGGLGVRSLRQRNDRRVADLLAQARLAMREDRFGAIDPEQLLAEAVRLAPGDPRVLGLRALAISDRVDTEPQP
jgi:DNA-binding winged helix-turn-helix (wHTH) protein